MPIGALIAIIGADPVETIEVLLDGVQEVAAGNDRVWHRAHFLTGIGVQIQGQATLVFKRQVVTVFAFLAFLANTSLEVGAQSALFINYKHRHQSELKTLHNSISRGNTYLHHRQFWLGR